MPIDVTDNYVRARQRDPGDFQKGTMKTITLDKSRSIKAVIGKPKGKATTTIQTVLFPKKSFTVAQAKKWLKDHDMKTEETQDFNIDAGYLDPLNKRFPIYGNHIFETLLAFNAGVPKKLKYTAEQYDYMGRKLARELNKYTYSTTNDTQYDEDGNLASMAGTHERQSETRYEYQDGQIVVVKDKSDGSSETTWERNGGEGGMEMMSGMEDDSDGGAENDEAIAESDSISIFEADSTGAMIKAMRMKKKMSRTDMAANMSMSKARLTEIEDDVDEPDENELADIARALGMTPKRMRKMMDAMLGNDDENEDTAEEAVEFYEIVGESEDDGVYDIVERAAAVVETVKSARVFTNEVYEERVYHGETIETHRLIGDFIAETIEEKNDGTIKFDVPLFKIGELTSNGNRYTKKCAENLINDLGALRSKYIKKESSHKRTALDIGLGESVEGMTSKDLQAEIDDYMEGRTPDMLATHRARMGQGNPLLETAGAIVGGRIGDIEGDPTFFLKGETIETSAGKDITVLIKRKMLRGVSLFGLPTEFEENSDGGADVDRMRLVGTDFTNDGGNLIQFRDKKNAGFAVLN